MSAFPPLVDKLGWYVLVVGNVDSDCESDSVVVFVVFISESLVLLVDELLTFVIAVFVVVSVLSVGFDFSANFFS